MKRGKQIICLLAAALLMTAVLAGCNDSATDDGDAYWEAMVGMP